MREAITRCPSSSSGTPVSSSDVFATIMATFRQDFWAAARIASSIRDVFILRPNGLPQGGRAETVRLRKKRNRGIHCRQLVGPCGVPTRTHLAKNPQLEAARR